MKWSHEIPKQPRLLFALQNLRIRPYCWGEYLKSLLNMERSSFYLLKYFTHTDRCSGYWKWLGRIKGEGKYQPHLKPFDLQWWPTFNILWCINGTKIIGINNQYLIVFKKHSMRWNPCLILFSWPKPGTG